MQKVVSPEEAALRKDIQEMRSQALIKLEKIDKPEIDEEYYDYGYERQHLVSFQGEENKLASIKVILEAIVKDLEPSTPWYMHETEKLARAYYTSFCNG